MKPRKRAAINSSATHVFEVLRTVADDTEPAGVSEISRRLGLTGSSVFRALTTLEATGYVSRYRNMPQFELGMMPYLLNRALLNRFELNAAARPFLREMVDETGETVSLSVRLGWYSLRVSGIFGSRDIYHRDRLGELAPLHESLAGRAILAFLPDGAVAQLWRFVENPAPPGDDLAAAMAAAREAKFLTEALPMSPGFAAIAMPVRDGEGAAIAAMTINGPVYPSEKIPALLAIRDRLESLIRAAPKRFVSPFAHIPADQIKLRIDKQTLPI
jgi:DNA-binding IclR family transcriptional regulator